MPSFSLRFTLFHRSLRAWLVGLSLALGVLFVGGLLDTCFQRGIEVTWAAQVPGSEDGSRARRNAPYVPMATTTEDRVDFPNRHRALSRLAQGWNFEDHGIPGELFAFQATLRSRLHLDAPGFPAVTASGNTEVRVDGEEVSEPLPAGVHDVEVVWRDTTRNERSNLSWQLCRHAGDCDPMPAGALHLPQDRNFRGWQLFGCLALALLLLFASLTTDPESLPAQRRFCGRLALAAIVAGGLGLRLYQYDVMPELVENGDELFATWNGWQLLEDGETRGWSLWAGVYGDRVQHSQLEYFGLDWNIIEPYFEHPPLLHVLVGAASHLGGAEHWAHSRLKHTRLVPIGLSVLTMLLIFALGRRLWPRSSAPWFAVLLYATLPLIALQNRVIKEEALLAPLSLASILLFLRFKDRRHYRFLILAAVAAGACTLAKVTGFAFVLALLGLAMAEKNVKAAMVVLGVGVATSTLLFAYGAIINWDTFVFATEYQGTRPTHFNIFTRWFYVGQINHNIVGRGWAQFLWIAAFAALLRRRPEDTRYLVFPLLLYVAAITVGSGNWTFGWYAMPFFPFLCLAAGRFLEDLWAKPDLVGGALVGVVLVMYSLNFVVDPAWEKLPASWPQLRRIVLVTVAVLLAPWAAAHAWPTRPFRRIARGALVLTLAAHVILSAYFIANYERIYETHHQMDRDHYFGG